MARTTHASRPDSNKRVIVDALRAVGATVTNLAGGQGVPDLLVGHSGKNTLIEIKSGRAYLNPAQQRWHGEWRGQVAVCRTVASALAAVGIELQKSMYAGKGNGSAMTPSRF